MRKTKAGENSPSLTANGHYAEEYQNNTVMRNPYAEEYQNTTVSQISGKISAHAQTAETRLSFRRPWTPGTRLH